MMLQGIALEFSAFCPADLEKYELAREKVSEEYSFIKGGAEGLQSKQEYIELLRKGVDAFAEFFDTIFGEGTSNLLFGEKTDFASVVDIYLDFVRQVQAQVEDLQAKVSVFSPDKSQP